MPFLVRHGLLGYLTHVGRHAGVEEPEQDTPADDNDLFGDKRTRAARFKTRADAELAAGPLLALCSIERVKK